jgi:glycosyltransferase involved in cell wall biosynthesis
VKSVLEQTYPNVEYIVKDGGSTDGTLDLLEKYRSQIDHLKSIEDAGISDAWNQALTLASGKYIALLNCDDRWPPDFLVRAVKILQSSGADLAFGDAILIDEVGSAGRRIEGRWHPSRLWQGIGFLHPSVVATRDAYSRIGGFREELRFAMDADWLLRLHQADGRFVKHDSVCYMSTAGLSNRHWMRARKEYLTVLNDNAQSRIQQALGWSWLFALWLKKTISR